MGKIVSVQIVDQYYDEDVGIPPHYAAIIRTDNGPFAFQKYASRTEEGYQELLKYQVGDEFIAN